ncbi:hypothetical protein D9613_006201 [Agrocybe pediades]|uniref:F-box domain-containing protein n=1 Tax=Agrocybe pediades TaxID=84607 RepID=A0A8H4QU37_9AGAR|nr:hypothetical protein D9613_006201 [Agrocybe pediades]
MPTSQASEEHLQPPIARLHDEILWLIMLENTKVHHANRLTTARYTSQVCRRWRQLMLDSPSIWGRLIDLNRFPTKTFYWMQVVMSRSGDAPLWITGSRNTTLRIPRLFNPPDFPDFVFTFIRDNWGRIEKLNVCRHHPRHDNEGRYGKQFWVDLFSKPAPLLEEFHFEYTIQVERVGTEVESDEWYSPSPWFDASAPALKTFCFRQTQTQTLYVGDAIAPRTKLPMWMPAIWFSKLRSFALYQSLDFSDLLVLLRRMPLLEELEISATFTNPGSVNERQHAPVHLPRLSTMRLKILDFCSILLFLDSITPSSDCCLSMSEPLLWQVPELHEVKRVQTVLLKYVFNYCEAHDIAALSILFETQHIQILGTRPPSLSIFIPSTTDDTSLLSLLINSSLFNSVHTLSVNQGTLEFLFVFLDQGYHVLFPRLHTLKIVNRQEQVHSEYGALLHRFLRKRQEISRPVSALDFSQLPVEYFERDFDDFEEFVGLSITLPIGVRWRMKDGKGFYVCGSGSPEFLRFNEDRGRKGRLFRCGYRAPRTKDVTYGWSGYI